MPVDYDRLWCSGFVTELRLALSEEEFVLLWCMFIFPDSDVATIKDTTVPFWNRWNDASLWNKQSVLFFMRDVIEEIATAEAMKMASRARKEEPL